MSAGIAVLSKAKLTKNNSRSLPADHLALSFAFSESFHSKDILIQFPKSFII